MYKKVWITGSSGLLGSELSKVLPSAVCSDLEVNISKEEEVLRFIDRYRIEAIVNCAAYTAVDAAEKNIGEAFLVNSIGPKVLSAISLAKDIKLIQISTDYVFDGESSTPYKENAWKNPIGIYGLSKLYGEDIIGTVLRTSWLYGKSIGFPKTIAAALRDKEVRVVDDQYGRLTYAPDLCEVIVKLLEMPYGIYHFANEGECSWADIAEEVARIIGEGSVERIKSHQWKSLVTRPKYSVLDTGKIQAMTGMKIRNWKETLQEAFNNG